MVNMCLLSPHPVFLCEHIIQQIDLNSMYWQMNIPDHSQSMIWGLDIDKVKVFDEYVQLIKILVLNWFSAIFI